MPKQLQLIQLAAICSLTIATDFVSAEEVRISFDGKNLNADAVVADGKTFTDGVIMIVHGTLGHKDMEIIEALQSVLLESGHSSLAINLSLDIDDRHGFYPCDTKHMHQFDDAIAELAAWREWLNLQGATNVVLLGHSRGANQAAKYALSNTASISNLVLLAPPASDGAIDNAETAMLMAMDSADWIKNARFLHCENADVQVKSYLSYVGPDARNDTVALMNDLRVPTLVLSGSEDAVVADLAGRMVEVTNEAVSYIEIEGAGHFFRDLYAYDVVDAIDAFLAQDTPPNRVIKHATSLQDDVKAFSTPGAFHVIFISQAGCQFCELLRENVLFPMIQSGALDHRVVLREVSLDNGFELKDFQQRAVKGLNFAERYGAYVTPTLLFLDANGNRLTEPLVGTGNIEFYDFYLDKKIEEAAGNLQEQ